MARLVVTAVRVVMTVATVEKEDWRAAKVGWVAKEERAKERVEGRREYGPPLWSM